MLKEKHITQTAYNELTSSLDISLTTKWKQEEIIARKAGGEALRIYELALDKGIYYLIIISV